MKLDDVPPPTRGEVLAVVGPTASGKTALAVGLAERFDGEIVSADSVQIYRRFDIGSGKPSAEERARATHHLVDAIEPLAPMDAARFARLADEAIASIHERGKVAIVCGGTYLWVKALLHGLAEAAPRDDAVRTRHAEIARDLGRAALHAKLALVDPEAAERLAPNDFVRVSRALEIHELTGRPMSAWHREHAFRDTKHPHRLLGVDRPRDQLDRRIEARARGWLDAGWIAEVRMLLDDGFERARALGSVGYKEVAASVRGEIAEADLLVSIVRSTRTFVRRQRTWLRDEPVSWVETETSPPAPRSLPA